MTNRARIIELSTKIDQLLNRMAMVEARLSAPSSTALSVLDRMGVVEARLLAIGALIGAKEQP